MQGSSREPPEISHREAKALPHERSILTAPQGLASADQRSTNSTVVTLPATS